MIIMGVFWPGCYDPKQSGLMPSPLKIGVGAMITLRGGSLYQPEIQR